MRRVLMVFALVVAIVPAAVMTIASPASAVAVQDQSGNDGGTPPTTPINTGVGGAGQSQGGVLARTGGDILLFVVVAAALVGVGTVAWRVGRPRAELQS
jgi:hypothetical protein